MNYVTREEMIKIKEDRDSIYKKNKDLYNFWYDIISKRKETIDYELEMKNSKLPLLKRKRKKSPYDVLHQYEYKVKNIKFYENENLFGMNFCQTLYNNNNDDETFYSFGFTYDEDYCTDVYILID